MAKFKDIFDETKLIEIAEDATKLLSQMKKSNKWADVLYYGCESYRLTHTPMEVIAFKLAIHFHIIWYYGEDICKTVIYKVKKLANMIGESDIKSDCSITAYPYPMFG